MLTLALSSLLVIPLELAQQVRTLVQPNASASIGGWIGMMVSPVIGLAIALVALVAAVNLERDPRERGRRALRVYVVAAIATDLAIKLLSVVGLEADRALFLEAILPAIPKLQADKAELVFLDAGDELNRLCRWFRCDAEVAPLLERTFKGANLRLAQRAFQALLELEHPELRRTLVLRAIVEVLDPRSRFGVFDRKRAVLAVGGSGGPRIISGTLQVLLNATRFGMTPRDAVAAPRFHHQWQPDELLLERQLVDPLSPQLTQRGHLVKATSGVGVVQLAVQTPAGLSAASDPRKGGRPAGW